MMACSFGGCGAIANPDRDSIVLQATGAYSVPTQLTLSHDVSIVGQSARTTSLEGDGEDRVIAVAAGVEAELFGITVSDGYAGNLPGGNILNQGSLLLYASRVTRGFAGSGSGIASIGPAELNIGYSLVDNNEADFGGGGILTSGTGEGNGAALTVIDSTIAFNFGSTGGGIGVEGTATAGNTTQLINVTIANKLPRRRRLSSRRSWSGL
jgi:hypothetical protein